MGREIKRVPSGFSWTSKVWFGFVLDSIPCQLCNGTGARPQGPTQVVFTLEPLRTYEATYCELCEGEGKVWPKVAVPVGLAYQMWETTSEGKPISPAFDTEEELAKWLADNNASSFANMTATYDEWLAMIKVGSAPAAVLTSDGLQSGVSDVASGAAAGKSATVIMPPE